MRAFARTRSSGNAQNAPSLSDEGLNASSSALSAERGERDSSSRLPPALHKDAKSARSGSKDARKVMPRTSSSKKMLFTGASNGPASAEKLGRTKSSLSLSLIPEELARDPNEGGSFRSFHKSRKRDVFQHLSGAEKTSFTSKMKYDELLYEIEETLLGQEGVNFVRKKNVLYFEVQLPKSVLLGEIKVVELISECRVEARKSERDKRTDYWSFVEYYRRFEHDLRKRAPDAVVSKRTVREIYREQKLAQQTKEAREQALQIERRMIREAAATSKSPRGESEYQRLQKMFKELPPEGSVDENIANNTDGAEITKEDLQFEALENDFVDAVIEDDEAASGALSAD
mmetsp:Transcript_4350/g.11920  ORF Transcript_4350/g.11920 Transcript_4350/m.11920 type:complete len:344 (-) Transcript_4350:429-1460(-)|eukprot:CAMPEP_0185833614 /NCGR_PEP_ID=MMETSP1353-20130828/3220_1 /TAXON_ID=1077150 /ORGANISM="Erythrolobus australicus, Strain CCMP3124" /LENGTH=343 /DNA_ID=CAMNT_0028531927 /DNA_START=47 /DNA_END=1078 /DNA_ORIENTATION=-